MIVSVLRQPIGDVNFKIYTSNWLSQNGCNSFAPNVEPTSLTVKTVFAILNESEPPIKTWSIESIILLRVPSATYIKIYFSLFTLNINILYFIDENRICLLLLLYYNK